MGSFTSEAELGKKLQLARKRAGLTQQELCQKAGLSYSTLAKIERGAIKSPSVFTVAMIASATGTTVEQLLEMGALAKGQPIAGKQRSRTGVRFVYFDVNGTIVRFFEHAFTQIAKEVGKPVEIIESIFWHYDGAASSGKSTSDEVEKIYAKEFGIKDFSWKKYYLQNVEQTPGINKLIEWVADNYEIGLVTNNWLGYTKEMIKRGFIPKADYKAVVESAEVGCLKPEAKIYKIAEDLANVSPEEILFIDDKLAYLAGAAQAGWQTLHFDDNDPKDSIEQIKKFLEV